MPEAGGVAALNDERQSETGSGPEPMHMPEEIALRVGGITVKSLCELIRYNRLKTTTLGFAAGAPKGGPRRRLWGMTEAQLQALLAVRRPRGDASPPARRRTRAGRGAS
jgi:hypothetical protein